MEEEKQEKKNKAEQHNNIAGIGAVHAAVEQQQKENEENG